MISRRLFLECAASASTLMLLGGCKRTLIRPPDCTHFESADTAPVIDAHCHIFNATDLQVGGFINQVKFKLPDTNALNVIGNLVQSYGWAHAPSAREELTWLRGREKEKRPNKTRGLVDPGALLSTVQDMRITTDERYVMFWRDVASRDPDRAASFANDLAELRRAFSPQASNRLTQGRMILSQLQSEEGVHSYIQEEQGYGHGGIAIVSFLKTFFRFRTENAWTMLQTYGCQSTPSVDLICPALVDFDLWLGDPDHDGGRTRSHLVDQLEVMAEISLATEGRVKAMAPFNPLRAACVGGKDYVALSRAAIERYGCVAFKLYPPMGFAATGNASGEVASLHVPSCGKGYPQVERAQLDNVLGDFFDYCSESDVPVMAHASPSNSAYDETEQLAAPKFWRQLMGGHAESLLRGESKVRISLGHMGGDRNLSEKNDWRDEIISLMETYPEHVFADLGYYEHVLGSGSTRRQLATQLAGLSKESVWSRVMYGSDWSMLAAQPRAYSYLTSMGEFLESDMSMSRDAQTAILGGNARDFFGFSSGKLGWKRIEKFHKDGGRSMDALEQALSM